MSAVRTRWLLLALLALAFCVYAPSLGNTFTRDDRELAKAVLDGGTPNSLIHELRSPVAYFTSHYWAGAGVAADDLYRPVTILSFAALYHALGRWFGDTEVGEAWSQHLANVLLHLLAVWLAYRLLRLLAARPFALAGAAVFALHAIHSEVVAGIVGRAELLAFDFGAAATLLYCRGVRKAQRPLQLVLAGALLFLAFCSKESALAWAPFAWLFALAYRWARGEPARAAREAARAALVAAVPLTLFFGLRAYTMSQLGGAPAPPSSLANPLVHVDATTRVLTAVTIWAHGLLLTVLPLSLASDYGAGVFPLVTSASDPSVLGSAALLAFALALGLFRAARRPLLFVAVSCFFGFSFITSNVAFATGTQFGERLYFTPSFGLAAATCWLASRAASPAWARRGGLAVLAAWAAFGCVRIWQRSVAWKDIETLYRADLESQPNSALVRREVAGLSKDPDVKRRHLERAVELFPEFAVAWNDLAVLAVASRRPRVAEEYFRRGLACPEHADPSGGFDLNFNYALLLATTGRGDEAKRHLEVAARLRPDDFGRKLVPVFEPVLAGVGPRWLEMLLEGTAAGAPEAVPWALFLGRLAFERGAFARAAEQLGTVGPLLQREPGLATFRYAYAASLARAGDSEAARRACRELLRERLAPELAQRVRRLAASLGVR